MAEKKKHKDQVKELPAGEYVLRVKMSHPRGLYKLQRHEIKRDWQKFKLTAAEAMELGHIGAQTWVDMGSEKDLKSAKDLKGRLADLDKNPL